MTVDLVELFPASVGGPAHVRAPRDPFPGAAFIPAGGVTLAAAVGAGFPLAGDASCGGDLSQLTSRAREWRAMLAGRPG